MNILLFIRLSVSDIHVHVDVHVHVDMHVLQVRAPEGVSGAQMFANTT